MTTELKELPAAEYHADLSAVSRSMLLDFRESRRRYYHQYEARDWSPKSKSESVVDIGDLAHCALLEPDKLPTRYEIIPDDLLSGKYKAISSAEAKQFRDFHEAAGRIVLKAHHFDIVESMARAVAASPIGEWLKVPKKLIEPSIYWKHAETGILCRCRPDVLLKLSRPIILDIKTTDDPRPREFARKIENMGYWLQQSHYVQGVAAYLDAPPESIDFYFAAVGRDFPHQVSVHRIENPELAMGAHADTMWALGDCQRTGDWSDDWEKEINSVRLREWITQ